MATNNPVIPMIAQAFQNDPRTRLAQQAIQAGTSTAPVAGGGWGLTDGLARILQGTLGGIQQRKAQKEYKADETGYMADTRAQIAAALGGGAPPQAAAVPQAPPAGVMPPQQAAAPGAGMGMGSPPPMAPPVANDAPSGPPSAAPGGIDLSAMGGVNAGMAPTPVVGIGGVVPQAAGRTMGAPRRFSSAQLAQAARQFIPGVNITSGVRSAARNAKVGGKPNSQHLRGTAIDILPPKGVSPEQLKAQYAAQGAAVDVINEGDHYHIQGARNPQNVTRARQASASLPQGVQVPAAAPAVQTPDPTLPPMPIAPEDVGPVQSRRVALGKGLVQSDNPFSFMQGQEYLEKGLTEQNAADEAAAGRKFDQGQTTYRAGLGDYYGAQSQQRESQYGKQTQERQFAFADAQAEKEFGRQLTRDERQFGHEMTKAGYDRDTAYGLATLNNNADLQKTMLTISAAQGTRAEKDAAKRTAFLGTPAGAKMWDAASQRISANDSAISDIQNFLSKNTNTKTGGAILGSTGLSSFVRKIGGNGDLQEMEAITAKLAPMMRTAGSGSMSDKDLEGFRNALPSIANTGNANKTIGTRIINSMQRVNDFERSRMNALSTGDQGAFLNEWNAFKNAVPVASGKTFDDWKSSLRTVK